MTASLKRSILRWVHIIFALPLVGYIYGPPDETVQYLSFFRYVYLPIVIASGFWMWQGPTIRRLISGKPEQA